MGKTKMELTKQELPWRIVGSQAKLGNLGAALPSFPPKNRARMLYLRGNLCSLQSLVSEQ